MYLEDYHNKVQDFSELNNFILLNKDPTKSFQKKIKATIKSCQLTLPKDKKNNIFEHEPNSLQHTRTSEST